MARCFLIVASLILASAVTAVVPLRGQETPVFRAGATDVRVDAAVRDGKRAVSGLLKEDFEIRDEGAPQTILYVGRESEPLTIVLLLDVSGSTTRYVGQMASTARSALKFLNPGDRVTVMAYGRLSQQFGELSGDHEATAENIRRATREAKVGAGTATYPALLDAARLLQPERKGRRAILVLTDNQGLNYQVSDEDVLKALYAADAVLYSIVVGSGERPRDPKAGLPLNPDFTPTNVFKLAELTGGEAVRAERAGEAFADLIEHIRTRYSLAYRAPEAAQPGEFRRILVTLSPSAKKKFPRAEVRARSGYWVTK